MIWADSEWRSEGLGMIRHFFCLVVCAGAVSGEGRRVRRER